SEVKHYTGDGSIVFYKGRIELEPWSQRVLFVEGLSGRGGRTGSNSSGTSPDNRLIYNAIAEQMLGMPVSASDHAKSVAARGEYAHVGNDGYGNVGFRPHHAGDGWVLLSPAVLHGKVGHTDVSVR